MILPSNAPVSIVKGPVDRKSPTSSLSLDVNDNGFNYAATNVEGSRSSQASSPRSVHSMQDPHSAAESVQEESDEQISHSNELCEDREQASSEKDESEDEERVPKNAPVYPRPVRLMDLLNKQDQKKRERKNLSKEVDSLKKRFQVVVDETKDEIYKETAAIRDLQEDQLREVEAFREEVETMKRKVEDLEAQQGRKRFKVSFDLHWLGVSVSFGKEGEAG